MVHALYQRWAGERSGGTPWHAFVANRFELVLLAAHRARTIAKGSAVSVEPENDKNPVIALREIAEKTMSASYMREGLIHSLQDNVEIDEAEKMAAPGVPRERHLSLGR